MKNIPSACYWSQPTLFELPGGKDLDPGARWLELVRLAKRLDRLGSMLVVYAGARANDFDWRQEVEAFPKFQGADRLFLVSSIGRICRGGVEKRSRCDGVCRGSCVRRKGRPLYRMEREEAPELDDVLTRLRYAQQLESYLRDYSRRFAGIIGYRSHCGYLLESLVRRVRDEENGVHELCLQAISKFCSVCPSRTCAARLAVT